MLANKLGVSSPNDIALCSNGTHALNSAILGLLHAPQWKGAHVVTTATEHNSVLRPLQMCSNTHGISWTAVPCDATGWVDPNQVRDAMTPNTRLVIINHVSNVTGVVQDVKTMADLAHQRDAIFMLDAAQSFGYLPVNATADRFDIVAAPGHKGAGGLLGTGFLYIRSDLQKLMQPVWIGGTGTHSDSVEGPFEWQSAVESGNCNLPGIASLKAGLEWLEEQSLDQNLAAWTRRIVHAIDSCDRLKRIGPGADDANRPRLSVISLVSDSLSCHEMAMLLDSACGVEARSGLHCAGLIHSCLGTDKLGGTLRLSLGHTSTLEDVEAAIAGIEMLGAM